MDIQVKLRQQVNIARYMLLGTVIATALNLILLLIGSDTQIVYYSAVSYYFAWFGWFFDGGVFGSLAIIGQILAFAVLAFYMLAWYLAAKRSLWLKIGLGMVVIDAVALVLLIICLQAQLMAFFWELALHGAVIYEMAMGISARGKLDLLSQQPN